MRKSIVFGSILYVSGCASIVNDANIPLTFSFSDGTEGKCILDNKRGRWEVDLPGTAMIRRSDDALKYNCETEDGRKSIGSIASQMDAAKFGASVIFIDLGITDAITDKHRDYQRNVVIPVKGKKPEPQPTESVMDEGSAQADDSEAPTNPTYEEWVESLPDGSVDDRAE